MVVVCVGTALTPAAADAAAGPRIAAPGNGALVTRAPVQIIVVLPGRLTPFKAWLGTTEITKQFMRIGSRAIANIGRGRLLGFGTNVVSVQLGNGTFASSTFVLGRGAPTLLRASGPSRSAAPVTVTANAPLSTTFTARLNGRPLTGAFQQGNDGGRSAQLAADNGLRFGQNTVQITVYNPTSGLFATQLRTINVPRTRPLVGAGGDQFSWTNSKVVLSGLSSRPFRAGARLSYSWTLVRRPRGSRAALSNAGSARPSLVPDVRGRYTARLTVSEGCGRNSCTSSDTTTVIADATLPIGSRLQTRTADGSIFLDGKQVVQGVPNGDWAIFDRDTLEFLGGGSYQYTAGGLAEIESRIRKVASNPPRALVVLNGGPGLPASLADRLNSMLALIGATPFEKQRLTARDAGWSVVGPAGAPAGAATQTLELGSDPGKPAVPGAMTGFLQANPANHYYGFAPQDAVPFDTLPSGQPADGNTMTVASTAYTRTLPAGAHNGFHVLSFDPRSLKLLDEQAFAMPGDEAKMLSWLTDQVNSPIKPLVLIASIGSPKPGTDPRWNEIAQQIAKLGGTASVFNALNGTGGYALAGRLGLTLVSEAATVVTGTTARIAGVLGRTSDYGYQPLAEASTPQPMQQLLAIASQAPTPWPQISAAANAYITKTLGFSGDDLRRLFYADYATPTAWTKRQSDVGKVPYPGDGHGFTQAELEAAKAELGDEIGAVVEVEDYVNRLRSPFTEGAAEHVSLQQISLEIQKQFAPPPRVSLSPAFALMQKLLTVAGEQLEIPEFAAAGMIVGALSYLDYIPRSDGTEILGKIQARTDTLASELDARYAEARQAMTQLGLILVSDYGKLSTVGGSILHGIPAKVHSQGWLLPAEPDAIKVPVIKAAKQVFFSELMKTVWDVWDLRGVGNARDWYCVTIVKVRKEKIRRFHYYWGKEADGGQYRAITGFGAGGAPTVVQRSLGVPTTETYQSANPPPASLINPLFERIDRDPQTNRLGLYAPWFYRDFTVHSVKPNFKGDC